MSSKFGESEREFAMAAFIASNLPRAAGHIDAKD